MEHARLQFVAAARKGLCTMDPQIGRWLREAWGEDSGKAEAMNAFKLKDLVQKLLPECVELLKQHHSAGADARLHRKLAYALYGLGRAPCRLLGTAHQKRMLTTGEDNEIAECILCGERF